MNVRLVANNDIVLVEEVTDLSQWTGIDDSAPESVNDKNIDIRCSLHLSSHKIFFAGDSKPPTCLQQYALWSGRELLYGSNILDLRFGCSDPESLLIVAPEGNSVWEDIVLLISRGKFRSSAIFFLPYSSETDLMSRLVGGAFRASLKSSRAQNFARVSFNPLNILNDTGSDRIGLVFHSRPYCGRVEESGVIIGLCSSPNGSDGYCYGDHPCAFGGASKEPIEALNSIITFLNGCSTAFPPISNLHFPADALLGYRLYTKHLGVILGNLSLGPAEPWELVYLDVLEHCGADLVSQIRSLNRIRESFEYNNSFRVVGFGDGAIFEPAKGESSGSAYQEDGSIIAHWQESLKLPVWAKIAKCDLPPGWERLGLAVNVHDKRQYNDWNTFCINDPTSDHLLLILTNNSIESLQEQLKLELQLRSDLTNLYGEALRDAVQGLIAIISQGDPWDLQPVLSSASTVLRSVYQARFHHKISLPSTITVESLNEGLLNVLTYISQTLMEAFLVLLEGQLVDLGNLYGMGEILRDSEHGSNRKCPICGVPCWEKVYSIHGIEGIQIVQLQCAICAIVYDGPAHIYICGIYIRPEGDAIISTIKLQNRAAFPVVLSFNWYTEISPTPYKLTYERLSKEFETTILEPGEVHSFSFESSEAFLRILHFYFSANGYVGFVQIKDAEPSRNRKQH